MITKCFSFYVQSQCGNNQVSYSLDENFPVQDLEYIALERIVLPKALYQIENDFEITIDSIEIQFYEGNISFEELISKLQNNLGAEYVVKEYRSDSEQQTGKLCINRLDLQEISFFVPDQYQSFFGYLEWDGVANLISTKIVELVTPECIVIRSNAVLDEYQNLGFYDVLEITQLDSTGNLNFYEEKFNVIEFKKKYTKTRDIVFNLVDPQGNAIMFENCQEFYLEFITFAYETDVFFKIAKQNEITNSYLHSFLEYILAKEENH